VVLLVIGGKRFEIGGAGPDRLGLTPRQAPSLRPSFPVSIRRFTGRWTCGNGSLCVNVLAEALLLDRCRVNSDVRKSKFLPSPFATVIAVKSNPL